MECYGLQIRNLRKITCGNDLSLIQKRNTCSTVLSVKKINLVKPFKFLKGRATDMLNSIFYSKPHF